MLGSILHNSFSNYGNILSFIAVSVASFLYVKKECIPVAECQYCLEYRVFFLLSRLVLNYLVSIIKQAKHKRI